MKRHPRPSTERKKTEKNMISGSVTLTQAEGNHKQFVASDGRGHHFLIDDAAGNTGPKPIELIAIGLAGCTAFDVIGILRKKRQEVTGYEVKVEAEQRPEPPNVFTRVRIRHIVTGVDIAERAVEDAIHLSESKYCSVSAMIQLSAEIETTYEIVPAERAVAVGA
jgi:putative redox protein